MDTAQEHVSRVREGVCIAHNGDNEGERGERVCIADNGDNEGERGERVCIADNEERGFALQIMGLHCR